MASTIEIGALARTLSYSMTLSNVPVDLLVEPFELVDVAALEVDDSFKKVMVVRDPVVPRYGDRGVLVIGVHDFLLDPSSLDA